jgi:gamma-glutamyltranspeptidase / glutathione hydrolase
VPNASLARKPLYAPRGVVATSQPLAASAGLAVLRAGGNAVDAAIAAATALTVVQPGSNDIGADLFAIVWDGTRLHGLNASGRAPAALTWQMAHAAAEDADSALGGAQGTTTAAMPSRGWLPVTVPGAPAGWRDLHERFGSRPFASLFDDAIAFAERGYPVSSRVAAGWARVPEFASQRLGGPEFAEWKRVYLPGGRAPRAGERFANPAAARALRLIADSRADAFYSGEIAQAIAAYAAETGGLITMEDLGKHTSTWVDPIKARYRDHEVWELPPNGQGVAALAALGILEGFNFADATAEQRLHLQIEAMKLGFADAHAYVADPEMSAVPVAGMLDPAYLTARRNLIGDTAAVPPPGDPARGGTVYLCTADSDGMMVSLIQSNYMGFGSYIAVPGFGFGLQNRGAGFSLDPGHPNVVAGGKRPFHTIIPAFLTREGAAVGPFGVMGGHMQPQGHVQMMISTIDDGRDPQAALDAPRWYWHAGRTVQVESTMDADLVAALAARGHDITVADNGAYGYGQAIWKLADGAGYVAGSEGRADGNAVGY